MDAASRRASRITRDTKLKKALLSPSTVPDQTARRPNSPLSSVGVSVAAGCALVGFPLFLRRSECLLPTDPYLHLMVKRQGRLGWLSLADGARYLLACRAKVIRGGQDKEVIEARQQPDLTDYYFFYICTPGSAFVWPCSLPACLPPTH
jgi:hypothetical protein